MEAVDLRNGEEESYQFSLSFLKSVTPVLPAALREHA